MPTNEAQCCALHNDKVCGFNIAPSTIDGGTRVKACCEKCPAIPPKINQPPILPTGVVLTEKQKAAQFIVTNILGMARSEWNVVMFKNKDYDWLQYFSGLVMKMPTIIVIHNSHKEFIEVLKDNKLVKATFIIPEWNEQHAKVIGDKIAHFIKKNPQK